MDITKEFEIVGELKISLDTYERIKRKVSTLEKRDKNMKRIVDEVIQASKELASLLNHISKKTPNFDQLISAFNESADNCEIQKSDDNIYKIKLNESLNDREKDNRKD